MTNCIICGRPKGYDVDDNLFCKSCYYTKVKAIRETFDHDKYPRQIFEHYINLKYTNTYDKEELIDNLCKMYALAQELEYNHNDNALSLCVKQDILKLVNEYNNQHKKNKNTKYIFNDKNYRAKYPRDKQCSDGHYVRSQGEQLIDNWLYSNDILHVYEPALTINAKTNETLIPDFYLKKDDVYIEFWGIEDLPSYAKRKEQKITIYDRENINVIHLNQTDINNLDDVMQRELKNYRQNKEQKNKSIFDYDNLW